ncbi:putative RNA-binding protein [Trypanosoma rangeli]|uniref:Putative RNA-binding protein n=1 Tax=Trypanosoma rangeli TaxID=5698 RepID=A0A3R7NAM0_TRYRA|nr:putative RNA-binding protein [Trypanosoma rangeli]RNE99609.1 putative RNA-binding protein [Trypanosoma rangeli]|eukprot:RNE99609.1 putative RNA-binding protein [Trypanosoma rangeli]
MDDNLAAEIARIEAELEADRQFRELQQKQQQQQQAQQPFGSMDAASVFDRASPAEHNSHPSQRPRAFAQGGDPAALAQQQQQQFVGQSAMAPTSGQPHQFSKDSDGRSVFVGNLPKGDNAGPTTTPEELAQFFADCGQILNCTVLRDRATGELKGTAYLEFATYTAMGKAIDTKNNASFKGSTIIVC